MVTKLQLVSKCNHCNRHAVKHVTFGLLIADALSQGKNISSMGYTPTHCNLCHAHYIAANVKYVHFPESDIDPYQEKATENAGRSSPHSAAL